MIMWIIIGIVAYLLVGIVILVLACQDPWGALVLEIWYLIIFLWPMMVVFSLYQQWKK